MTYKVVTAVATEPVTLAEAKLHLRVDASDDDDLIGALITAAREFAEHYTGRALAEQTLEMALDEFPCVDYIDLDAPPVASVTSIKYTDTDGVEQTFSSASYSLDTYGTSRQVTLAYGVEWPDTREEPRAVRIRYVTGYATAPKAVKSALLLLIGHLYENRQDATATRLESIPTGAEALLDTVKVWGV
jgi:uncharacterized phiE125 gp8 family phage protein